MDWNPISAVLDKVVGVVGKYFPDELTKQKALADIYAETASVQLQHDKVMQQQEEEISKRWQADMQSDSWLAKNTRPLMLWTLFGMVVFVDLCAMFNLGKPLPDGYTSLLTQAFLAALGAYFVVRGVEKVAKSKYSS